MDRNEKQKNNPTFQSTQNTHAKRTVGNAKPAAGTSHCSPAVEKYKVFVGDHMGYLTCYALKNERNCGISSLV